MYPFTNVIGWFLHGILQRILVWIPLVNPLEENRLSPPEWWYECWWWSYWYYNIDGDGCPNETWCDAYLYCTLTLIKNSILGKANEAVQAVKDFLLEKIGPINWAHDNMGSWVDTISNKLGWILPWWATTAIGGLWKLWGLLPDTISEASQTWGQIWESIKRAVRDWAQARYEDARRFALNTWDWLTGIGQQIEQWWRSYASWLGELARDPWGVISRALGDVVSWVVDFKQRTRERIIAALGPAWPKLEAFSRDCLTFWYNLWGAYAHTLSDFLSDPLEYLFSRAEHFINRKLG